MNGATKRISRCQQSSPSIGGRGTSSSPFRDFPITCAQGIKTGIDSSCQQLSNPFTADENHLGSIPHEHPSVISIIGLIQPRVLMSAKKNRRTERFSSAVLLK